MTLFTNAEARSGIIGLNRLPILKVTSGLQRQEEGSLEARVRTFANKLIDEVVLQDVSKVCRTELEADQLANSVVDALTELVCVEVFNAHPMPMDLENEICPIVSPLLRSFRDRMDSILETVDGVDKELLKERLKEFDKDTQSIKQVLPTLVAFISKATATGNTSFLKELVSYSLELIKDLELLHQIGVDLKFDEDFYGLIICLLTDESYRSSRLEVEEFKRHLIAFERAFTEKGHFSFSYLNILKLHVLSYPFFHRREESALQAEDLNHQSLYDHYFSKVSESIKKSECAAQASYLLTLCPHEALDDFFDINGLVENAFDHENIEVLRWFSEVFVEYGSELEDGHYEAEFMASLSKVTYDKVLKYKLYDPQVRESLEGETLQEVLTLLWIYRHFHSKNIYQEFFEDKHFGNHRRHVHISNAITNMGRALEGFFLEGWK